MLVGKVQNVQRTRTTGVTTGKLCGTRKHFVHKYVIVSRGQVFDICDMPYGLRHMRSVFYRAKTGLENVYVIFGLENYLFPHA